MCKSISEYFSFSFFPALFLFFFLLIANCLLPIGCYSQNPDIKRTYHWFFGNGAGIDFSSGTAVADTNGKLHTYEGCAVMSDTAGNLLFYTDGDTVWNRNHQPMPNGTGLMGCANYGSSAQAALLVTHPGNDSSFYIFTSDCGENFGNNGYRYSIVNINLNGGLGDVMQKNILLYSPSTEGIAAVKHANEKDIWVMTHEYNTNNFHCYKIDDTLGLDTTSVINSIGALYWDYVVCLEFSHDGNYLASFAQVVQELFSFDNSSGILSNRVPISNYLGSYRPTFSPDNSKLYCMNSGNLILQYCLSTYDSAAINNSLVIVANNIDNSAYGALCNAPDNKIYVSALFFDSISTIENPNAYGSACNFKEHHFYLYGKQLNTLGLPVFVSSYFYDSTLTAQNCDSIIGIFEDSPLQTFYIYPNPANSILHFYSEVPIFEKSVITIYNLLGEIEKEKLIYYSGDIDVSDLLNGIYLITINTTTNLYSQKIIINH